MKKFDFDILRPLYKSIFDDWWQYENTDSNIGSIGDGGSLEVPRTP